MNKSSKSNQKKRKHSTSIGFDLIFCIPKHGGKVNKKKKKTKVIQIKKSEKGTETAERIKHDILTDVNLVNNVVVPNKLSTSDYYDFPMCEDIKGLYISIERSVTQRTDKPSNLDESSIKPYISKPELLANSKQCDTMSEVSSITLQDILDQNGSSLTSSPSFSEKLISEKSKKFDNSDSTDKSYNVSPKRHLYQTDKKNWKDGITEISANLDYDNLKIYDFFETATLVPIGDGVTSLSPKRSDIPFSPKDQRKFLFNNPEEYSPIIIPPRMPPLISLKPNSFSNRPRRISENVPIKSKNLYIVNQETDENDYVDLDKISGNVIHRSCNSIEVLNLDIPKQLSTYANIVSRTKSHMKKCSSNDMNPLQVSATKKLDNKVDIVQERAGSYNFQPNMFGDRHKTEDTPHQMSTAF